ncbi:MAG: DUF433 domain-containing protein [Woeseiaceae bacterium]
MQKEQYSAIPALIDGAAAFPQGHFLAASTDSRLLHSTRYPKKALATALLLVPLQKVRRALEYVKKKLGIERPLADARFETDGVDLFVRELEKLVNVSQEGQLEIEPVIRRFLKRIERDPSGAPIKLYPFTRKSHATDEAAPVEIDPRVAFGRPVLVGRGVPTAVLADRFKAGDSLADLAEDYDTSTQNIEEAIRCELTRREAA